MCRKDEDRGSTDPADTTRLQMIRDAQLTADEARSRWRNIMFDRRNKAIDEIAGRRLEQEESQARAAMIRADAVLFRLTCPQRGDTN